MELRTKAKEADFHIIIGDVHGCLSELQNLLLLCGWKIDQDYSWVPPKYTATILAGDLIDKGPHSKEVVQFVLSLGEAVQVVWGNHENFVWRWFGKKIKGKSIPEELRKYYFTGTEQYRNDPEFFDLLTKLRSVAYEFVENDRFIVTHAPCKEEYLGKTDDESIRNQRTFHEYRKNEFKSLTEYYLKRAEDYSFLIDEADDSKRIHIFGHATFKNVFKYKNKIGIDTGCVAGNKLTALYLSRFDQRFVYQQSSMPKTEVEDLFHEHHI